MSAMFCFKIVLLAVWAFFFGWLVTLGRQELARLLHPTLWWFVVCASVILILFLLVNLGRRVTEDRQSSSTGKWSSLFILLVPLLYFIHAQSARFNTDTLTTRILQTEDGFVQGSFEERVAAEEKKYEEENKEVSITKLFLHAKKNIQAKRWRWFVNVGWMNACLTI